MMLSDVRDYMDSLKLADHVYMGKLDVKKERSVGVYHSRHSHAYKTAIGGPALESYGTMYVTFLVHWNRSPRDTERAARELFSAVLDPREASINKTKNKFKQPLSYIKDVGTDDSGIYEMVIEASVIYGKGE